MSRHWKIVFIALVLCITLSVDRLFLMGRFVDVFVRLVEAPGRLGRTRKRYAHSGDSIPR
jgi:hypothetical protein